MAFTQNQLDELDKAIANGRMQVEYDGRKVTFRTLDDMLKLRDLIRQELGLAGKTPRRRVASHDKGIVA